MYVVSFLKRESCEKLRERRKLDEKRQWSTNYNYLPMSCYQPGAQNTSDSQRPVTHEIDVSSIYGHLKSLNYEKGGLGSKSRANSIVENFSVQTGLLLDSLDRSSLINSSYREIIIILIR